MIRFIHCADLHFDRPFEGISAIDEEQAQFYQYNEQTLKNIVDVAIDEAVDFVLFAGDTFHQNRPTLKTQRLFFEQMERLKNVQIQVYLAFGNHDFYDATRYWFDFPENVHLFTTEQIQTMIFKKDAEHCHISAFSYTNQWIDTKKVREYPNRGTEDYHIAMYHGEMGSTRYAQFQLGELQNKGYDYWALGHIHVPMILQEQPPIIYAGTPMGHSQKEDQIQGVVLVTLQKGQIAQYRFCEVAAAQWQKKQYSFAAIQDKKSALDLLYQPVEQEKPTLYQVQLIDTNQLPKNWLEEQEKAEVIAYLNRHAKKTQQWIYAIKVLEEDEVTFAFDVDTSQIQTAIEQVSKPEVFETLIEDLRKQTKTSRLVSSDSFRMDVLTEVYRKVAAEFQLKEGE